MVPPIQVGLGSLEMEFWVGVTIFKYLKAAMLQKRIKISNTWYFKDLNIQKI